VITDLAEKPRPELPYPLMLRVYGWAFRLTPGLVLWLLRVYRSEALLTGAALPLHVVGARTGR